MWVTGSEVGHHSQGRHSCTIGAGLWRVLFRVGIVVQRDEPVAITLPQLQTHICRKL